MKAFIYARQSSGGDDESLSIDVQVASCRQYAEKEGINTVGVFCDYNTSGRCFPVGAENIAEKDIAFQKWFSEKTVNSKMYRTELGKLFSRLSEVDVIIVDDITRLYRPLAASFLESYIHQILIIHQIKIHTVKGGIINTASFNDSLLLSIQNQVESQAILVKTEKSKSSLRKLKNEGWTCGCKNKMIGYRFLGKQKYEINQDEVPAVLKAFELILQGYSYNYISSYINKYLRMPGRQLFAPSHVPRLIGHPEYCGLCYNCSGELIESKVFAHIPIIDKTTWYKAQEVLKSKKKNTRERNGNIYTVVGLLKCGICGHRLTKTGSNHNMYYFHCNDLVDRTNHVNQRYSYSQDLFCYNEMKDNIFGVSCISDNIYLYEVTYPLVIKTIIDEFLLRSQQDDTESEILTIKTELEKIVNHEKKLSKMLLDGVIDDEQFTTMAAGYKHQRDDLKHKLSELNKNLCIRNDEVNVEEMFKEFITGETDDKMVKVYLHKVVEDIIVFRDKITINFKDHKSFDLPIRDLTAKDRFGRCRRTLPSWEIIGNLNGTSTIIYYTDRRSTLYSSDGLNIITLPSSEIDSI